jgi:hypothetical protein
VGVGPDDLADATDGVTANPKRSARRAARSDERGGSGQYPEQIVTRSGRVVTLPRFGLVAASWGLATPVPVCESPACG